MSSNTTDTGLDLLARLLSGPSEARQERLELLRRLLEHPAAGWTPQQVRVLSPLDDRATEAALSSLKRAGALVWNGDRGRYLAPVAHRPALTALYLLGSPTPPAELMAAQSALFGWGADEGDLPLAGLIDLLEEDIIALEQLPGATLERQIEVASQLDRHVADAEQMLGQLADGDHPRAFLERGLDLVARLGSGVSALLGRLAKEGTDRLPVRAGLSPAELRLAVRRLDQDQLSGLMRSRAPRAPRAQRLPDETALAAALERVGSPSRHVSLPDPQIVERRSASAASEDSLGFLARHLPTARPAHLGDLVGSSCPDWNAALIAHHGFVRLHERLVGAGRPGLRVSGDLIVDPSPEVALISNASVAEWESALVR